MTGRCTASCTSAATHRGKLELLLQSGAQALSLEESKKGFTIDIEALSESVHGRAALLGNLDAIHLLPNASEQELRARNPAPGRGRQAQQQSLYHEPWQPGDPGDNPRARPAVLRSQPRRGQAPAKNTCQVVLKIGTDDLKVHMITPAAFSYYDLRGGIKSRDIDLLFPGWAEGDERVAVISPHDDDGVLGAGYLILAALANGARVTLVVVCNGCFGYSRPEDKPTIVARRKAETLAAYQMLGLSADDIIFLDYPDFSAWPNLGWHLPGGQTGAMSRFLPAMRQKAPTRLVLPNSYREHQDHEAAYRIGAYDGPADRRRRGGRLRQGGAGALLPAVLGLG